MAEAHAYQGPQIGLALGGGGARGLAHVGVLKALEREGIPVHAVAGTSMGGVVGALLAAGVAIAQMEEAVDRLDSPLDALRLLDIRLTKGGVLKGHRVQQLLVDYIGAETTFADLAIPFGVTAVDLNTGRPVVLKEGPVVDAVRATISIPGVFEPVETKGCRLVDGGVLDNVPVNLARDLGAGFVIAVDVMPNFDSNVPGLLPRVAPFQPLGLPPNLRDLYTTLQIMMSALTADWLRETEPEAIIRPDLPDDIGLLVGFDRAQEIIAMGEAAAVAAMPRLKEAMAGRSRRFRLPFGAGASRD